MFSDERNPSEHLFRRLILEDFHELLGNLQEWRIDPEIKKLERGRPGGLILGFIKGLRLSAKLIYAIRKNLSRPGLEVNWGHLYHADEGLSPECDIIIHLPGRLQRWNGSSNPIMDVSFVDSRKAIAVVSCKSFIRRVDIDYCSRMKPYVSNILLFAECCAPGSVQRLKQSAKSAGYKGFWYLYTCTKKCDTEHNENEWLNFLEEIRRIVAKNSESR